MFLVLNQIKINLFLILCSFAQIYWTKGLEGY